MDIQLLNNQLQGLASKLLELRKNKSKFDKAQGLQEQEEKLKAEIQKGEGDILTVKKDLASLKSEKAVAVKATAEALASEMGKILPEGKAYFDVVAGGKVVLGLDRDGRKSPYEGLSGGEKVSFGGALSSVLLGDSQNKTIIIEGAELDEEHLWAMLNLISKEGGDTQYIVNTCHRPEEIPEEWKVVTL